MVRWSIVDCFDDIDDSLNAFSTIFNEVLDKHAPIRKVKIRGRLSRYITDEIRELMKSRDLWRRIARRTSNSDAWTVYKILEVTKNTKLSGTCRKILFPRVKSRAILTTQASCGRLFDRLSQRWSLLMWDPSAKTTGPMQMILIGSLLLLVKLLLTRLIPLPINAILICGYVPLI